jgi:hypothetical protein
MENSSWEINSQEVIITPILVAVLFLG